MIPHDGSGGRVELAGTLARGLIAWCPILRGRSPQKDAQVTKTLASSDLDEKVSGAK
jgi:hypothetical protein